MTAARARVARRLLAASLPLLLLLSMTQGPADISLLQGLKDLLNGSTSIDQLILLEVRLPRALLALLAGAALGLSGAALQGLLRNPLASPDLLGVSQTAVLGAIIALYFGFAATSWLILPLAAMTGALLAVLLMFLLARRYPGVLGIILVGIAINAVAGAFSALALNYAPNAYALQEVWLWMLGSVANRSFQDLAFATPFILVGAALILPARHYLDALTLGEDSARSLGFHSRYWSWLLIGGVALCTGAAVSVTGNIAFVGLMTPHLMRPLVARQPGQLLWLSAVAGAALVLLADLIVRWLPGTRELQLGVITSALGGPFFFYLIYRQRQHLS